MPKTASSFGASFKIRTRIAVLILVPVLGFLVFSSITVSERMNVAANIKQTLMLVEFNSKMSAYVHSLQREAGASAAFVTSGGKEMAGELSTLRQETDKTHKVVTDMLAHFDIRALSNELNDVLTDGLAKASQLDTIREKFPRSPSLRAI